MSDCFDAYKNVTKKDKKEKKDKKHKSHKHHKHSDDSSVRSAVGMIPMLDLMILYTRHLLLMCCCAAMMIDALLVVARLQFYKHLYTHSLTHSLSQSNSEGEWVEGRVAEPDKIAHDPVYVCIDGYVWICGVRMLLLGCWSTVDVMFIDQCSRMMFY